MMSMMGLILVAQAAAPLAATPPDIELRAQVQIRSLEIRNAGTARLELRAAPGEAPPVEVERSAPAGAKSYRNLRIGLTAIARLTPPGPIAAIDITTGDNQ